MAAMKAVGNGGRRPAHARVQEELGEYVVELGVPDFAESELTVDLQGRTITVRGDQVEAEDEDGKPFRLHERVEESFRLPDDVDANGVHATLQHRTLQIHAPRGFAAPRRIEIDHAAYRVNADTPAC
ncbi:MAG: Hsp20/alpha crystallin family protein [Gaiellaceae bacterium]